MDMNFLGSSLTLVGEKAETTALVDKMGIWCGLRKSVSFGLG